MREKGIYRYIKIIYILLMLTFSVEYVGDGVVSVFRLVIFPISLAGFFLILRVGKRPIYEGLTILWSLYMFIYSLCLLSVDDNFLFPIFCLPLIFFMYGVWTSKKHIQIDYSKITLWYFLPHLVVLITGNANFIQARFAGLHYDPNFCGIFLSFSILSALSLLRRKGDNSVNLYQKIGLVVIVLITMVMLFMTGSRGAMLSVLLVMGLEILMGGVKKRYVVLAILVSAVTGHYLWNYILDLPDWVSPDSSFIDSVLCRFKPETISKGSSRVEIWEGVFNNIERHGWITPIGRIEAMRGVVNVYTHNTYIDFLVDNGVVLGSIVVVFLLSSVVRVMIKHKYDDNIYEKEFTLCCLAVMTQLFFLSAIQQKILWICIIFIVYKSIVKKKNTSNYLTK